MDREGPVYLREPSFEALETRVLQFVIMTLPTNSYLYIVCSGYFSKQTEIKKNIGSRYIWCVLATV